MYTSSPKRATVAIPRVARLKREGRRERRERERERERWMDIQALNGSEKSAKSVGIYSTNASAQRRAFTTFFFLYLLPVSCTAHNHPRNRQPPWPLPEQQFCLYTLVRGTKSDTIWTSFWKGGGGRGEEKEVAEEREKEKKRMKPLFLPLKRGPWARPGEFFTESPRWKEISALAFLSIADGTHVCFHWEILLLPSLPFFISQNIHDEWKCSSSSFSSFDRRSSSRDFKLEEFLKWARMKTDDSPMISFSGTTDSSSPREYFHENR